MNKQMKNAILVGVIVLLLSACGGLEPASAPAEAPEPIENAINLPTAIPVEGSAPAEFSRYIGLNYPPLPDSLVEGFSMLIQDANDYSLSLRSEGENRMLWLSKMTHRDSNGNAYWEIKAVLDLSNVEAGLVLVPDGCSLQGAPDHEILAAYKDGTVQLAWRANTSLERFEVIPTDGITCDSDKGIRLE